jgi:hypothetical protein
MAKKEKESRISTDHGVYIEDGKYHCDDCDHEMDLGDVCPTCHKQVDWDEVMTQLRSKGMG